MNSLVQVPYCGAPPVPGHVVWNTDPILAAALLGFAVFYWIGTQKKPVSNRQVACFWSGWVLASLALLSPLCNLSVALFSARIAQHVILTTLAAPLVVLGGADRIWTGLPAAWLERTRHAAIGSTFGAMRNAYSAFLFAVVMWLWHVPALYDATFRSTLVYWAMHVTMIGTALWLWSAVFSRSASIMLVLSAVIATMLQMSLLGALLTLAGRPLFAVHSATTWPWGLSQLQDQQLGGLIMWVIGGFLVIGSAIIVLADYLMREPEPIASARQRELFGITA